MHKGSKGPSLARAVFARSIKVLGWQPEAPKPREHNFLKKRPVFLNFIGSVAPLWVLYPSEILHMDSTESLLARAKFVGSIKVLGWQPGASKTREHDFPKKSCCFFEIRRTTDTSMGSLSL